ncbi:MAG: GNAT family N-acetyltransferase [Chthoniobacterales bacterium]
MDYVIRPLTSADEAIIWEMLYQALQGPGESTPPPREIVRQPEYARYAENWGREGDRGFVVHDKNDRGLLGAAWFRAPAGGATPELAFAVRPGHRKRGIGAALLTKWVRANPEQNEISLRVGPTHPAVRLYERFGFKVVAERATSVTMRREG